MTLVLRNRWKYQPKGPGRDWWEWEAFLEDGGSGELGEVAFVEYVLHPTYGDRIRRVTNPTGGFALKAGGLGGFTLTAFLHLTDGSRKKLQHMLQVDYRPDTGTSKTTEESTRLLQELLKGRGLYTGPLDGKYGAATADAVRTFQREQGLDVDGFAGPRTRDALLGEPRHQESSETA